MLKTVISLLLAGSAAMSTAHAQTMISRQQAVEDIDSLVRLIEGVEVDPYMQLPKETFYEAVTETKSSLPADSIDLFSHFLRLSRLTGMFK